MNQEYVTTSDMAFAAYLMLHDYTAITCIDPEDGRGRFDFYMTHADNAKDGTLFQDFNRLRDDFASIDESFNKYHKHLKRLRSLTFKPIRKSEYGA